ncbi:hypothetical protein [Carboxydothermus hydrogenoformans]|uniref:hypothetical protein n=1 Tax=Carboxydothermus hydrogenoformans TaxID=129958 RepID=UPI001392428D|nr:hypothetical protein [Carboxydothermus hydrogenoformans]
MIIAPTAATTTIATAPRVMAGVRIEVQASNITAEANEAIPSGEAKIMAVVSTVTLTLIKPARVDDGRIRPLTYKVYELRLDDQKVYELRLDITQKEVVA